MIEKTAREHENTYELEEKTWVIAEYKPVVVEAYRAYLICQEHFLRALGKIESMSRARTNFIAALFTYFSACQGGFVLYMEQCQDQIKKKGAPKEDVTIFKKKDYLMLPLHGEKYDNEKLLLMADFLNEWNMRYGYFRIMTESRKYADIADMLAEENET
jgi:hypothetical protein